MSQEETPIPPHHTRVYRVMCEDEYRELFETGEFREGSNSLEGKWFADSLDGALEHARVLYPDGDYRVVEVDVSDFAPSLFKHANLDGHGPARYLHVDDLLGVTPRPCKS